MMKKVSNPLLVTAIIATTACVTPLESDASELSPGIGISWIFGEGVGVGFKAFFSKERDKGAASIGIDYMVNSRAWRPNVGISYLGHNHYSDFTVGYNIESQSFNLGMGIGYINTANTANTANTEDFIDSGTSGGGCAVGVSC